MIAKRTILFIILQISTLNALCQKNKVAVNPVTGSASLDIPIGIVKTGDISVPISLTYYTSGVRVKDVEDQAGMGWHLNASGQISRELRGLPDDCSQDMQGHPRKGWLYAPNNAFVNLTVSNDGNPSNCSETNDLNYLTTYFSDNADTEPDIFHINAPGMSCSFIFDKDHNIKTIPYQDLKISYTTDSEGLISQFHVVNNKGVVYKFTLAQKVERFTRSNNEFNIGFFKKEYDRYVDGVRFNMGWYLTSITDATNNTVIFTYREGQYMDSATPLNLYFGSTEEHQYNTEDIYSAIIPTSVSGATNSYVFDYSNNGVTNRSLLKTITNRAVTFILNYTSVYSYSNNSYMRCFLRDITTTDCNTPFKYHFSYLGENELSSPNGATTYTTLPDSASKSIDYWGYYNGNANSNITLLPALIVNPSNNTLPRYQIVTDNYVRTDYSVSLTGGTNRSASANDAMAGALSQIGYGDNASTTILYESNDYYDVPASHVIQGGGIRVKSVIDYDGVDVANNIATNYSYEDPVTGLSSGKPISLPQFAFTRPYLGTGLNWDNSTIRSTEDLSKEDHSIYYRFVRKSQAHAGSTLNESFLPGTYWDNSASPADANVSADWTPTIIYAGKPLCTSVGNVVNAKYNYPFAPNINYDFERGIIKKVVNYNDLGNEVSETSYTYQRTQSPDIITGLILEDNSNAKMYSKYNIYASTGELLVKSDETVFDSGTLTQAQTNSTFYFFDSPYHKLLTQKKTINSDGAIKRTFYKYVKDYTAGASSDANADAIYHLQQLNINLPVETWFQDERNGVNKTVSGNLVKFKLFNAPMPYSTVSSWYNLSQVLKFSDANGVTDFAPSDITSNIFTNYNRYNSGIVENDLIYDHFGIVQTKDDNNKHIETILRSAYTELPVATIKNASSNEVGYFNINSPVDNAGFAVLGDGDLIHSTRTGQFAVRAGANTFYSKTIHKNSLSKNYIFSVWATTTTAGTVTLSLTNSVNQTTNYTISLATNTPWKYSEIKVPVTNMSSDFTAKFQVSTGVIIDETLFYPEVAEVSTYQYDGLTNVKVAETNTNGIAHYYSIDQYGRLNYLFDKDKQILLKKSYNYTESYKTFVQPTFTYSAANQYINSLITFSIINSLTTCTYAGATLKWDFGDGQIETSTSYDPVKHSYTQPGNYTVTLTVTSPDNIQYSKTMTLVITDIPTKINYNNYNTSQATFDFYQNSVLLYTFTSAQLAAAQCTVPKGIYEVHAHLINNGEQDLPPDSDVPLTNKLRINFDGTNISCDEFSVSTLNYTLDLRAVTNANFLIDTTPCP
ncbi:PKD domain-containing protein [Mucilaginibacter sp. HMF5004]|uniref:PKD domain-containing protein n=1 Tax=Mucilaginibacter rivuli TaxID=2857527 RepID=UPI001C5CE1D5|nr:PKD domain-containing protein [Mucilaginibacter rivuli]MBW4890125.1 PKD domain-containing protein [Mucilaginibacter rivuli]